MHDFFLSPDTSQFKRSIRSTEKRKDNDKEEEEEVEEEEVEEEVKEEMEEEEVDVEVVEVEGVTPKAILGAVPEQSEKVSQGHAC